MKKILPLLVLVSSSSFANCLNLESKIDTINAKLQGLSLAKYLATGAGFGVGFGYTAAADQARERDSYMNGYNAGATPGGKSSAYNEGYQAGYKGAQSTDTYIDGSQNGSTGRSSIPREANYVASTAVGLGAGVAVGGSVYLVKKMVLKNSLRKYETIYSALAFGDDESMKEAASVLVPKSDIDLAEFKNRMETYKTVYCSYPGFDLTIKHMKQVLTLE